MTRSLLLSTLFLISASFSAVAQQTGNTTAAGGPDGIYVALGTNLPTSSRPINGGVAYLVDRRVSGEQGWQEVTTISAPASLEEFRSRLESAMARVPLKVSLSEIPVDTLWQIINRYGSADSLKFWSGVLLIRLASGMMYLDTTAQRDVKYQYRVSLIDQSKRAISVLESNVESYPGTTSLPKLHSFEKSTAESHVTLEWTNGTGKGASLFRTYRQDGLRGEFEPIAPLSLLTARHDSVFYLIEDTLVKSMQGYRYFLLPMDYYGNPGVASDTVTVGAYEFQQVPLPEFIHAVSLDSLAAIRVSWHLRDPRLVRNLTIYRSTDFDTGYVRLSGIATGDTSYIDQDVKPMVKYFYYLVMHGPLGESSPTSARVFGMYISGVAPIAPGIFGAVGTSQGVRLSIVGTDIHQINYQVYRNDGTTPELRLISGLVPRKDSITIFGDTSSTLSGNLTYSYSVRAENASHDFSPFSDTVHVRPHIPTHPPTPLGLNATVEGRVVQLYWNDMRPSDNAISGYFVFRREINRGKRENNFVKLNDTLLSASNNRFTDTMVVEGKIYEYAVRDDDFFGGESPTSMTARAEFPEVAPIPPGGIRVRTITAGVLVQWDATVQPNLREYRVYRYQRRDKPINISTIRAAKALVVVDRKAKKGNLYFYYVTAVSAKGVESVRSQEVGIRR